MTTAANLPQAAGLSFDNLQLKWLSNHLKDSLFLFWQALLPTFDEQDPNDHPVSNWLVLIASFENLMTQTNVPIDQMTLAAEYVYRICWMTETLRTQNLIDTSQAAQVLIRYNAAFG